MSDVSVVGLGSMGSALARALVGARREVAVWNRTSTKADALVQEGAVAASSVAQAVEASPVGSPAPSTGTEMRMRGGVMGPLRRVDIRRSTSGGDRHALLDGFGAHGSAEPHSTVPTLL